MNRMMIVASLLLAAAAGAEETTYTLRVTADKGKIAFSDIKGADWKTTTYTCAVTSCEAQINSTGVSSSHNTSGRVVKNFSGQDLGFKLTDAVTIRTRCLRPEGCSLQITNGKNDMVAKTLRAGQTTFVRSGSEIRFTALPPATPPSSSQNH